MRQAMKSKLLLKIIVIAVGLFFNLSASFGQYGTFNAEERGIKDYSHYDDYLELIKQYNEGTDYALIIKHLDSIAGLNLKASDYPQFLFFKNEAANFYRHQGKFIKSDFTLTKRRYSVR